MAYGDPIDRSYLDLAGIDVSCDSIDPDFDDSTDWVKAMTRNNEPLGLKSGNRTCDCKVDVTMREGEINFLKIWKDKTNVPCTIEYESGRSFSFSKGRIGKPSISAREGEKVTWSFDMKLWMLSITGG